MAYYDENKFNALPKDEVEALATKCKSHDEELRKSGQLILVGSLAATQSSMAVRPRHGEPAITDGPCAETKEQLGAFFIIEPESVSP